MSDPNVEGQQSALCDFSVIVVLSFDTIAAACPDERSALLAFRDRMVAFTLANEPDMVGGSRVAAAYCQAYAAALHATFGRIPA